MSFEQVLFLIGVICVIAGISGGGIKLIGQEVPILKHYWQQGLLAAFGIVIISYVYQSHPLDVIRDGEPGKITGSPCSREKSGEFITLTVKNGINPSLSIKTTEGSDPNYEISIPFDGKSHKIKDVTLKVGDDKRNAYLSATVRDGLRSKTQILEQWNVTAKCSPPTKITFRDLSIQAQVEK